MTESLLAKVRHLARAGDTERAWDLFLQLEPSGRPVQAETLTLKGKLLKDRALKSGSHERGTLLDLARMAYLDAVTLAPATYPLINAATLALLAGHREQSADLADRILAMVESGAHEPETPYWLAATRAEACLLLGRIAEARHVLAEAVGLAPHAWEDHASTLRQFRLILQQFGETSDWLDAFRPPTSLHLSGIIHIRPDDEQAIAAIGDAIDAIRPGFVFGSLAAGADILAAEMLVERDTELHVMLPATVEAFRRDSVSRFGAQWEARFDMLIDAAHSVESIDQLETVSEAGVLVSDEMAMGRAIRHARMLESQAVALRIGDASRADAETLDAAWRGLGLSIHQVPCDRQTSGSIALPGFRREAVLALPIQHDMAALSAAGAHIERAGTHWLAGFDDPSIAAHAALEETIETGVPLGVAYGAYDPATGAKALHETAIRIAGASLPERVPVSRPTAMALALKAPTLRCENAGHIASACGEIAYSILSRA